MTVGLVCRVASRKNAESGSAWYSMYHLQLLEPKSLNPANYVIARENNPSHLKIQNTSLKPSARQEFHIDI